MDNTSVTSAVPVPLVSFNLYSDGMQVRYTSPSRANTPAATPSAGLLNGPANSVDWSATPLPVVSTSLRTVSPNFSKAGYLCLAYMARRSSTEREPMSSSSQCMKLRVSGVPSLKRLVSTT